MDTKTESAGVAEYLGNARISKFGDFWLTTDHWHGGDEKSLAGIRNATFGDADVIITTFPKSGTAWMERIVTLMTLDSDVTRADSRRLDELSIMIEKDGVDAVLQKGQPRVIKTHLDYAKIPQTFREGKGKIIYVARNPKDLMVSYYYFAQAATNVMLDMPFDEFFERFLSGDVIYGPWHRHIQEYWSHRSDNNVFFLHYEDLQKDPKRKIREIATFLERDLTEGQIDTIATESSFNKMKMNPSTNYDWYSETGVTVPGKKAVYMRKGIVGDWKTVLSPEQSRRVDELVATELAPLGISFSYE